MLSRWRNEVVTTLALLGLGACLVVACGDDRSAPDRGTAPGRGVGKADGTNSCQGHCGGQAPAGCWCDAQCENWGDCCYDKAMVCDASDAGPGPALCEGHCGGQAPQGCWCDSQCDSYGDCCPDKDTTCGGGDTCQTNDDCAPTDYCQFNEGECISPTFNILTGTCEPRPEACAMVLAPVCGCDGNDYDNACFAAAAGTSVAKQGACGGNACEAMDAAGEGMCEAFFGYAWNGTFCSGISGCSCQGADCGNTFESKAACEAAYADCITCWGAWIDENGGCRAPNDGGYPDICCKEERQQLCSEIASGYSEALPGAKACFNGPTFAPQCTEQVLSGLPCGCPTYVNSRVELDKYIGDWETMRCMGIPWVCPAVLCAQVDGASCEGDVPNEAGTCVDTTPF